MKSKLSEILVYSAILGFVGCGGGTAPTVNPIGPAPGTPEFDQMTRTAENDPDFKGQRFEDPANKDKKVK